MLALPRRGPVRLLFVWGNEGVRFVGTRRMFGLQGHKRSDSMMLATPLKRALAPERIAGKT